MALATTRIDSLARLSAVFDRASFGSNQGGWQTQASGATPEADTGPGSNSGGPYVYCNAAGAADETVARANSILTVRQYIANDWTGTGRQLQLVYCITGAAFDDPSEGLEVEALRNGAWQHRVVLNGWPYSDTNVNGDTVTDVSGTDHVIHRDGNWVRLTFNIPDDATNIRLLLRLDDDTDLPKSNAALWSIRLLGGPSTQLLQAEDYRLLVDWANDGTYSRVEADVWPRVIENTFSCVRGRNFASQRTGRSVAGQLTVELDNRDGLFDPDNTMSALSGLLGGGRRVRFQVNDGNGQLQTQWTGWLRDIHQIDAQTGFDRVRLRALGVFSRLRNRIHRDQRIDETVQSLARRVFDPNQTMQTGDHEVDGADYRASLINGNREVARWWEEGKFRINSLRDLEQTEGGFLWETKDGFVALDAEDNRQSAASRISQATFNDGVPGAGEIPPIADGVMPDHPHEDLANIINSQVQTYSVGNQQVLWSVTGLTVGAGADFNIQIEYPNQNSDASHVGVNAWTALAAGTDYTARGGLTLTLTTEGNEANVRIQNTGTQFNLDLQLRGTPVIRNNPIQVRTVDQDSVDEHGPVSWPFETPWLSDIDEVESLHTFLLRIYGEPAERLTLTFEADSDLDKATALDLSDRVTVTRRGITDEFFIESIRWRLTAEWTFVTLTLSPAGLYGEIFILGTSRLGEGILAA